MRISFESPAQPDAIVLVAELDAYQDALYQPESRHALDLAAVAEDAMIFLLVRDDTGQAVGCGAVVLSSDYGELKRIYVRPAQRGAGVAKRILHALEAAAMAAACHVLKLESGPYQPAALGLYARCGYDRCSRFGDYADDPMSVFMQKKLVTPAETAGVRSGDPTKLNFFR